MDIDINEIIDAASDRIAQLEAQNEPLTQRAGVLDLAVRVAANAAGNAAPGDYPAVISLVEDLATVMLTFIRAEQPDGDTEEPDDTEDDAAEGDDPAVGLTD